MIKTKVKLAYRIMSVYLTSHLLIVLSILGIMSMSVNKIEQAFLEEYINNGKQSMAYFDEELLGLKRVLAYTLQSEGVLTLSHRYKDLSKYNKIKWRQEVKEELILAKNQYKWIKDIGVYIPEINLWIETRDGVEDDPVKSLNRSNNMYVIENKIYLTMFSNDKVETRKVYIELDTNEFDHFIRKFKHNEDMDIQCVVDGKILNYEGDIEQQDKHYEKKITIKSMLYPFEIHILMPSKLLDLKHYFYIFIGVYSSLLILITLKFTHYLNKAIHHPLRNLVNHIEGINSENFDLEVAHSGIKEFDYVTEGFNRTKGLLQNYINQSYEQEMNMKQMELDHLQQQIKPHFLYNCFFNIANMCRTYDVDKIEALTIGLGKYYRYITRTGYNFVRLEEEYNHMVNYIAIQKIRFDDRVHIHIEDLPEEVKAVPVPRIILQPIVENAYKYVFDQIESKGYLYVGVIRQGDFCIISIEDNGTFTQENFDRLRQKLTLSEGTITSIVNIKKRLGYMDERNEIHVQKSQLGGMCIQIKIHINTIRMGEINV